MPSVRPIVSLVFHIALPPAAPEMAIAFPETPTAAGMAFSVFQVARGCRIATVPGAMPAIIHPHFLWPLAINATPAPKLLPIKRFSQVRFIRNARFAIAHLRSSFLMKAHAGIDALF